MKMDFSTQCIPGIFFVKVHTIYAHILIQSPYTHVAV